MAQTQTFSVPMANINLAPSEALNQIMDNLNHLNIIVNQAVNTIHSRIKEESLLLSSISKRVDAAFQKTQLIAQNPNKSTTIYSSPNYPMLNNQDKKPIINQPLINNTHNIYPNKPVRSNYNLSLKQRSEKPANVETVSLLKTIKEKTNPSERDIDIDDNALNIDDVSSVADCMIFGTNINAYNKRSRCSMFNDKRKRKSDRDKDKDKNKNRHDLGPQPESMHSRYNLRLEQKTYGNRIRYLPDPPRKNMPKFNVAHNLDIGVIAKDVVFEQQEKFMIPSEVLNASFDFGDDVEPPTINNDDNQYKHKHKDSVSIDFGDDVKPPTINVDKDQDKEKHHYPTPIDDEEKIEEKDADEEEKQAEINVKQPIVPDVKAQNEPLQRNNSGFDADALMKGREALISRKDKEEENKKVDKKENENEKKKEEKDKKSGGGLAFDADALKKARERLNKSPPSNAQESNDDDGDEKSNKDSENENVNKGMKDTIWDAMRKRRVFMESDDDEEEEENGSFSD